MEKNTNSNFKTDEDIINYIKEQTRDSKDMVYKKLEISNKVINIIFSQSVCNGDTISDFVIRSIKDTLQVKDVEDIDSKLNYENSKDKENIKEEKSKKTLLDRIKDKITNEDSNQNENVKKDKMIDKFENLEEYISVSNGKKLDLTKDDIFYYIFSGFTLIIYNREVIAVETKAKLDRSISEPQNEATLKGAKDSFIENYMVNIGLIRKRIKSEKLILEEENIGRRSKTKVGIVYISDIVRPGLVKHIKERIAKIDIDAILDSNYIVEIIEDSNKSDFPTTVSTERPDKTVNYLLQGRVAIVVENSPFVIIVPAFLPDFVNSIEDNYQKYVNVGITRIIRYIALFITIFTPGMYVALTTFNQESIPTDLLLAFSTQRQGVPFPAYLEAILMIVAFEILREGDYRVPNVAGSTLSIVGALILGDAAVSAGIVSPIMIIVVAITTISGLMFNDINMSNALRTWRFIMLIFGSVAGIFGIGIGTMFLITKLCSTGSFTKPYLYPIAPFELKAVLNRIIKRENIATDTTRSSMLTDNTTKYKVR